MLKVEIKIDESEEGIAINIRSKIVAWLSKEERYSSNIESRESESRRKRKAHNMANNLSGDETRLKLDAIAKCV